MENGSKRAGLLLACMILGFSKPASAYTCAWQAQTVGDGDSFVWPSGDGRILTPAYFPESGNFFRVTIPTSLGSFAADSSSWYEFYVVGHPTATGETGMGSPFFGFGNVESSGCFSGCDFDDLNNSNTGEMVQQAYMPLPGQFSSGGSYYPAAAPWLLAYAFADDGTVGAPKIIYPVDEIEDNPTWSLTVAN